MVLRKSGRVGRRRSLSAERASGFPEALFLVKTLNPKLKTTLFSGAALNPLNLISKLTYILHQSDHFFV